MAAGESGLAGVLVQAPVGVVLDEGHENVILLGTRSYFVGLSHLGLWLD
jgi:hypothetical protein